MSELTRNPDILTCLANLSNDEVFTPPEVANAILDLIPEDFWKDPNVRVLDPACKSGVFLREAAKRFLKGEEEAIPDLKERIDHIFHKQLFGYAITELTSHLSRRTVYCSKTANGKYSVTPFKSENGNIAFSRIEHTWEDGKCKYCGASQEVFDRGDEAETHAYKFIHLTSQQIEDLVMKFDLIIGNPPYQIDTTNGAGKQAKPIYNLFVEQAKKLKPRYLTMIIPSRWFAGGMGLDNFRNTMMNDNHILKIVDYANAKDCFVQNSISGGVCYFLWDRDNTGLCDFTNIFNGTSKEVTRALNQYPVLVRYNTGIDIIKKVKETTPDSLSEMTSPISPFGIPTNAQTAETKMSDSYVRIHTSKGEKYIQGTDSIRNNNFYSCYKVLVSQTSAEHAGEPSKDGTFKVLTSSMKAIGKGEICSHSYILIGPMSSMVEAKNACEYLKTKFVRFLILMALSSIHISKKTMSFVPMQDFSKPWTDEELYEKYGLSDDEIKFIESMIKPME